MTRRPSPREGAAGNVQRPAPTSRLHDPGPFDIVGDVHGCYDELAELLSSLGYRLEEPRRGLGWRASHAAGRRAIFLGDLVDRGPAIGAVLRLAMNMVQAGSALCVPGNHDMKLVRMLRGYNVRVTHGLDASLKQLAAETPGFRDRVVAFLDGLPSHYVLDEGRLVVAHAGMKEDLQGKDTPEARSFALFGQTTGEIDEYGLPVRVDWAAEYRGQALVVYGHMPVLGPRWAGSTVDIDTGCVFGGALSALRYPERERVQVRARRVYYEPIRPLQAAIR